MFFCLSCPQRLFRDINIMSGNLYLSRRQLFDCHLELGKWIGIKLGYAVTSLLKCNWHLEQGESISITQRVHYE